MPTTKTTHEIRALLREFALTYPEAHEEFPWGERVIKVRNKIFLFLGVDGEDELRFSVKLPASSGLALALPFATPTGYGLGKSGWVSMRIPPRERPPIDLLREWVDESYRAIAPKRLSASVPAKRPGEPSAPDKRASGRKGARAVQSSPSKKGSGRGA